MTSPDWCDLKKFEMDSGCNFNRVTGTSYYTLMNTYLDVFLFEMTSWVFMLILILYDMFMIEIHSILLIIYCFLYIFDIITGFLFFNNIITIKVNLLTRFMFLILYWRYSRLIMLTFVYFLYKVRMIFYLIIFFIIFSAMVFNIIFFDSPVNNSNYLYSGINFQTISNSIFSVYIIFTQQNVVNVFNENVKYHPAYVVIILPLLFCMYYLVITFLIAVLTYFYNKIIRREIRSMEHFQKFKKVFYYFMDKDGIVNYKDVNEFIKLFYKSPHSVDFDAIDLKTVDMDKRQSIIDEFDKKMNKMSFYKYEKRRRTFIKNEMTLQKKYENLSYNSKHYKAFNKYRRSIFYRCILVINDTLLGVSPVLIINSSFLNNNDMWYIFVANMAIFSLIDPFLNFVFAVHKLSAKRRSHYIINVFASVVIVFLSLMIWIQPIKLGEPISQTYLYSYLVFSFMCFIKISTIIDQAYHAFPFFVDMLELLSQLTPFYYQIIMIICINLVIYSIIGTHN